MGAFAIYAFVVTGLYILYMSAVIMKDLFGKKGQKKDAAEEFNTADIGEESSTSISPARPLLMPGRNLQRKSIRKTTVLLPASRQVPGRYPSLQAQPHRKIRSSRLMTTLMTRPCCRKRARPARQSMSVSLP